MFTMKPTRVPPQGAFLPSKITRGLLQTAKSLWVSSSEDAKKVWSGESFSIFLVNSQFAWTQLQGPLSIKWQVQENHVMGLPATVMIVINSQNHVQP